MPPADKKCCWSKARYTVEARHLQQSFYIFVSRTRDRDDLTIDTLYASQSNLCDQPPDSRMKPENGQNKLFKYSRNPVVATDVYQFVAGDRLLCLRGHCEITRWQQNQWPLQPECDGACDLFRSPEIGTNAQALLRLRH